MKTNRTGLAGAAVAASALAWAASTHVTQLARAATTIGPDDIAGVVTEASGSEPGVWVIARTSGLPTKTRELHPALGTRPRLAEDARGTRWTSGGWPLVGWLNTWLWAETGDEERAQA